MSYRSRIANFGLFLVFLGAMSAIVQIGGCEMRMLRGLNSQPPVTAWGIRLGMIVAGVVIFLIAGKDNEEQQQQASVDRSLILQGLAQDPHMAHLLRYVYQSIGATLAAQPGAPRVVHLLFMSQQGYGSNKTGAIGAIALIEGPQGRMQGTFLFAQNQLTLGPCDPSMWNAYMSY